MKSDFTGQVREIATQSKYTTWYLGIVSRALGRVVEGYTERHHILPKSLGLGGEKDEDNIVRLTAREHFVCHMLLTKVFRDAEHRRKMRHAFRMISNAHNRHHQRHTSRQHTRLGMTGHSFASAALMKTSALKRVFTRVELLGMTFNSNAAARRHFGLSPTQLTKLKADPTEERLQWLRDNPLVEGFSNSKTTVYNGVTYPSIRKAAKAVGLTYTQMRGRLT